MRQKLAQYNKDGIGTLKLVWRVIVVLGAVQIICAIAAAAANSKANNNGYKSASFTAIWSMFIIILFVFLGGRVVLRGRSHPIIVGFMIGMTLMLAQLMFVIMCIFFGLGSEAVKNGWATAPSDNAMGSFTMFNMILYFIWGVLLIRNRQSILLETTVDNQQQHAYDDNNDQENPTFENDDFETHEKHEEEEL